MPVLKLIPALLVTLFVVSIPYLGLAKAYFLGYDDFHVLHRAAFEDTRQPSRMFTTRHYDSPKYRPLDRVISLATYDVGGGNPFAFRARNITLHLLNCALVFALGLCLFESSFIGLLAALLYGLNPLANQAVAGAGWTITPAASAVLISVLLGLRSYGPDRRGMRWLVLGLLAAWFGVFLYEPDLSAVGIIWFYFVLDFVFERKLRVKRLWIGTLFVFSTLLVGSMILARALVLHGVHQPIPRIATIAKNTAMYAIAILTPVDPLLLNRVLGTPLPSEISMHSVTRGAGIVAAVCILCFAAIAAVLLRRFPLRHISRSTAFKCVFLLGAVVLCLLPQLVFTDHPSETYMYLPESFAMLLLARILVALHRRSVAVFAVITALLVASFGFATWERNERVISSSRIAQRILSELPISDWREGSWHIRLANASTAESLHRYGLYTYSGLDTIGVGDGVASVEMALQLRSGNDHGVVADVLSTEELPRTCSGIIAMNEPCFWIYPDGRVEKFQPGTSNQRGGNR